MSTSQKKITGILVKDKKKAPPKTVRWNDDKDEGPMSDSSITIHQAASGTKKSVDDRIQRLMQERYSELEATAIAGKSITPSGKLMLNEGIFYESKDTIQDRKNARGQVRTREALNRREKKSSIEEDEDNRYGFFSIKNISIIAATTATLAVSAYLISRNK